VSAQRAGLELLDQLAEQHANDVTNQAERAWAYHALGTAMFRQRGFSNQVEEAYSTAIRLGSTVATEPSALPEWYCHLCISYLNLGNVVGNDADRRPEMEVACKQALAIFERLATDSPFEADYQYKAAVTYGRLGRLYDDMARPSEAEAANRKCFEMLQRLAT